MLKTRTNCEIRKCGRVDMCEQCKNNPPNKRDHTLCTGPNPSSKKRKKIDILICHEKIPKNLYTDTIPKKKAKKCSSLSNEQNLNSNPNPKKKAKKCSSLSNKQNLNSNPIPNFVPTLDLIPDGSPKVRASKYSSPLKDQSLHTDSYKSPIPKKRGNKYSSFLNRQRLYTDSCQQVEEHSSFPNSKKLYLSPCYQDSVEIDNEPLYPLEGSFSFLNDDDIVLPEQNLYQSPDHQETSNNFETSPESKIEIDLGIQGDQKLHDFFFNTKVSTEGKLAWPIFFELDNN